ncbi:stage II sporulation protein R [Paramaledivibacter caminithermalis]|jgi:stage II sporulation protein R|uniref:Stage II sporulation protein R n=1 Tax=Paramaledivibacter caminithermalis (strain DSM 15212 / CIP 107654 / DViRD3) TaxID=1121301 RepID=A0A1M6KGT8_PARC5|nr:stage II sporulation protein R [Paramaledivibacter caminithermalis]SHJ58149.1 stage II sporulation protein R [Paramaledivibacter caminithermalis DSM 15212]
MKNKKLYIIAIIILGLIASSISIYTLDVYKNRESFKENLIRFHVIANSDASFDQALKLKVRDKILMEMGKKLKTKDINEAKKIIANNMDYIKKIAMEEINQKGFNYPVKVMLQEHNFPTKNYGSITLPAGSYQALRVVIGSGQGKNWWCVLFPPLCFIDVKNGLTDEKTKAELKTVLSEEEYSMINAAASQEGELPIKLKFKLVEILENSKWKLSKIMPHKKKAD